MTKDTEKNAPVKVLMLMTRQCTYCGAMMQALTELMKTGALSQLEIVNIEQQPELAAEHGVRSVPWLQIGAFELSGARSKSELELWLQRAGSASGMTDYISTLLLEGEIEKILNLIAADSKALTYVIQLMVQAELKMNVKLGIGVIVEELAQSDSFKQVIPLLSDYLSHDDSGVRADACHYLSLTGDRGLAAKMEKLLDDDSEEVREIAAESIESLLSNED